MDNEQLIITVKMINSIRAIGKGNELAVSQIVLLTELLSNTVSIIDELRRRIQILEAGQNN